MSNLKLDLDPSYYTTGQTANWIAGDEIASVAFTTDGAQPTISEYIAYDNLNPPNPFIAVTQDGNGNVVYDGGFPKFYNGTVPAPGSTFAQLNASYKFLYNAINFVANPTKVSNGNKKILVIGDSTTNYNVLGTDAAGFYYSFNRIAEIVGFTVVIKNKNSFGGIINASLSELEQYALVIIMSSEYIGSPSCTPSFISNVSQYRENGSGVIIITDHGGRVLNTIQDAINDTVGGFYALANKLATNFGCWFSGNYDRSPVNVGFLRANYGDHPLYKNMTDSESIFAGGSESKISVTSYPTYLPNELPQVNMTTPGRYIIQALAILSDGSMEIHRFVYIIAVDDLLDFEDPVDGSSITETPPSFDNTLDFDIDLNVSGLGTVSGRIIKNTTVVGDFEYDDTSGRVINWYAGDVTKMPVTNNDSIWLVIDSPFSYQKELTVNREVAAICSPFDFAETLSRSMLGYFSTSDRKSINKNTITEVAIRMPHLNLSYKHHPSEDIKTMSDWYCNKLELVSVDAYIYETTAILNNAILSNVPNRSIIINAETKEILINRTYSWDIVPNTSLVEIFNAPRNIHSIDSTNIFRLERNGDINLIGGN